MSEVFQATASFIEGDAHKANARALRQAAKDELSAGYREEEGLRRDSRQLFGIMAATIAESGSVGGTGDILVRQSEARRELDALNIRYGAKQRARGLRNAARGESAAATSSYLGAGAALLGASLPGSGTRTLFGG